MECHRETHNLRNALEWQKEMPIELGPGENLLNIKLKPIPPKFEDLDLSVFKTTNSSLEVLYIEKRERVLQALNFLYDALSAFTYVQSYIEIYRALSYLMDSVGRQGKSLDTASETFSKFKNNGILTAEKQKAVMKRFEEIHKIEHGVAEGRKVKRAELDEIKAFFKEFLVKYIEYAKLAHKEEC
jgi:hypothetical protein